MEVLMQPRTLRKITARTFHTLEIQCLTGIV
jgi:hypothetical protein